MTSVRVRYGRDDKNAPKNTLVTIRNGDTIYFGIARCQCPDDRPNKETGKELASRRAHIAASNVAGSWIKDGGFYLHKSGLLGQVPQDEMLKLLNYFEDVDALSKERARNS